MNRKILKRLPLHKLMDLKVDYAFKQMFGSEKNKEITIVFLNAILQRTGRDTIQEVLFANQETGGEYEEDKQSRLDIVVKTQKGEWINVEMQLSNQEDMLKRTLYYWSRLYAAQLQKGKGYRTLRPTITINICNFTVFEEQNYYHSTYHLYEDTTLKRLQPKDDVLEIHFIEMNKFLSAWHQEQLKPLDDILARWLLLLGMVDARKERVYQDIYRELEVLAMKDETLLEAFNVWESLSQTPDTIIAYQSRLKAILDEEARLDDVREKSLQEGLEKGLEQGIEKGVLKVAKELIALNLDMETIQRATGLTEQEIEKLCSE
ncbi:Rpn family recombination-promoting nuclease/putative transposase [Metasolibacillus sp.]|nr:Rpn family recombination-promoting nuclease/putative transposase [Metasolibacillus sp.]MCT6922717.1 Rpn family recombination-promoting nuclease/putative transposase [Metasolibacillus sp.]MCT6938944.1 Rpn family recombination-promoting nuclease/putative transposase [Metasolibacillus sp.]